MASSKVAKAPRQSKKAKSKLSTLTLDSFPPDPKNVSFTAPLSPTHAGQDSRPLTFFSKHVPLSKIEPPPPSISKGKGIATAEDTSSIPEGIDQLWVDTYAPETEAELAVHKKKVDEVRRWLLEAFDGGPTGVLTKYRKILALTGPSGTGKTAVLKVLARELGFEINEWNNSMDDDVPMDGEGYDRESLIDKFQKFFGRASSAVTLPFASAAASSSSSSATITRQINLLEDIPNVLHPRTAEAFHEALEDYVDPSSTIPLVIIVSDPGVRGEDTEGETMGFRKRGKEAMDIRSVVHPKIFNSPYFTEIQFNPIAPTLMVKGLNSLLTRHFSSTLASNKPSVQQPSKDVVQLIVESAHGDIRSAIMALQFACVVQLPKGKKGGDARRILEAVTRREQSLALFHMLGKVLYNKRKGDPPNPSASTKLRAREEDRDIQLPDPPELSEHLSSHARRTSRVDINRLYADSPIDTSLFATYLHQNYAQFCDDVDDCDAVCQWFSWIDAMGGEAWQLKQNPHQFHILTLGTLHGLPSPVPRRSQKLNKPEFFDMLRRIQLAEGGITDTETWLHAGFETGIDGARRWGQEEIVLELGGVLKARSACGDGPPYSHALFSTLSFVHPTNMPGDNSIQQLGETEAVEEALDEVLDTHTRKPIVEEHKTGWLEDDDIEEF